MANEDKVVDFGAACYAGLPDGSAVDTGVSLHLDVVFEHRGARLKHFEPSPVAPFGKTKAVAANHYAVLQYDPVAKAAKFTHDGVRVREEIVANLRTAINCNETVQHGVAPNFDVFVNITVGPNMCHLPNPCVFRDDRRRVNPWRIAWRLIEKLDRLCKCQIGIAGAQRRKRRQRRLGMLDSCHTANLEIRETFQSASQFLRNFSEFHGEDSSVLCGAVCESRTGQRRKYSRSASYSLKRRG